MLSVQALMFAQMWFLLHCLLHSEGSVLGTQFGCEGPQDDPFLWSLWRGRLGQDKEEQLAFAECACAAG